MSFPLYDAHQSVQSPEQTALQEQYTEYFTQLFTKWIDWAILFYRYGLPVIKWSSFFFVYGTGGWREYFLLAAWGSVWVLPPLYFGIVGKELEDVKKFGKDRPLDWWIYQIFFWVFWAAIVAIKFALLVYIMRIQSWWMWPIWGLWLWFFGW